MELIRLFKRTVQYIGQNGTIWKYEHILSYIKWKLFVCLNAQYNI